MKTLPLGLALSAGLLASAPAIAQQSLDRVVLRGLADAPALARAFERLGLDVVEGGVRADSIELVVSPWAHTYLVNQGYAPELIEIGRPLREKLDELGNSPENHAGYYQSNSSMMVPTGYPDLATINAILANVEGNHPAIAKVVNLTTDYGAPQTWEGRDIMALKLSDNVDADEDEPTMLLLSNQHAREIITPVIAIRAAINLTDAYGTDPAATAAIDDHEIFIIPSGNPDGYDYVYNVNNNWRKNRRDNGTAFIGVDLNRNFQSGWGSGCSGSTNTCSDTYKGPAAFSEPEAQAIEVLTAAERFAKVIDFHSSGRETLWSYACPSHPWDSFMQSTGIALSQASGYGNSNRPPSADGEHYEWHVAKGVYSHLQETGTQFQPSFASAQSEAAACYGAVLAMLSTPVHFSGHVTDACSGAPVEATLVFQGLSFPYGQTSNSGGAFGRFDVHPPAGNYTVEFSAPGYAAQTLPVTVVNGATTNLDVALVSTTGGVVNYCTAGTSASGCQALLSATGTPSATAASGFVVTANGVEGAKDGLFFFAANGRQANPWGSGTSFQCVAPPVSRTALFTGSGTVGLCDGQLSADLNARWTAKPNQNPGAGATVQAQLWYRDPQNTSNQTTSLSDAVEFVVCQ